MRQLTTLEASTISGGNPDDLALFALVTAGVIGIGALIASNPYPYGYYQVGPYYDPYYTEIIYVY